MRDPYSIEAEHAVLGAMLQRPELIDTLAADLRAEDFFHDFNAAVFRSVMALREQSKPIDFLTVGEPLGLLAPGKHGWAYCAEIAGNTPSVANAKRYAEIVRERAIDRAIVSAGRRIREIGESEGGVEDKIAAVQREAMGIDAGPVKSDILSAGEVLEAHLPVLERREALQGQLDGLGTGIVDLDNRLLGLRPEQLIVLAGRPGMGKTALAMNIAAEVAVRQQKQVLAVSLEMSNAQLMDRFLAAEGRILLRDIKSGRAGCDENARRLGLAAHKIRESGLRMSDRPCMTMEQIRALARRCKHREGLDLIVIDYLQLISPGGSHENRVTEVSAMSRGAKLMARELQCPVLLISQLSRQCEQRPDKRPMNSDLRDSGAIEQDADVVLFVYRDELYHPDSPCKGTAEVIIGKGRDIETGTVRTAFLGGYSRFENLAASWREPAAQEQKVTNLTARYKRHRGGD